MPPPAPEPAVACRETLPEQVLHVPPPASEPTAAPQITWGAATTASTTVAESGPGAAVTASAPQVTSLRGAATTASTAAKGTRGSLRLQLGWQQGQLEGGLQRLFGQQGRRGGAATTARHRQWFTGTYC